MIFNTRLVGNIEESRLIAAVMRQTFFLNTRLVGSITRLAGSIVKSRLVAAVAVFFLSDSRLAGSSVNWRITAAVVGQFSVRS